MRLIGITGSIACGKSTVSREIIRRGFPVIDGDSLSRELTGPGGPAMREIRAVFGDRYVLPDGSLDRRAMGRLVFSSAEARSRLDQLMAPYLRAATESRIDSVRSSGAALCFLDMPLLFEKGYDRYCDAVWCVWLPEDLQLSRLMQRDGYSREEALSRIRSVLSSDEKADLSSVIIDNSGTVEDTLQQVADQLSVEMARSGSRRRRTPESRQVNPQSSAVQSPPPVPDMGFQRPEASRRQPSRRKVAWQLPRWLTAALIALSVVLILSFTAQMLMNAYLTHRQQTHEAEQQSIDAHYPLYYEDLIRKYGNEYNLSPSLIASIILNESSFRPDVQSSVGARGLMQLMPATSQWIAEKLKVDNFSQDQLDLPDVNIRFGCWYLSYLSSLFNGNPLCVACAYHAGQGEVRSWLANPLYSTDGVTLNRDSLPEGPTKIYAGRVTRDYGIYQAKYFQKDDLTFSDDPSAAAR